MLLQPAQAVAHRYPQRQDRPQLSRRRRPAVCADLDQARVKQHALERPSPRTSSSEPSSLLPRWNQSSSARIRGHVERSLAAAGTESPSTGSAPTGSRRQKCQAARGRRCGWSRRTDHPQDALEAEPDASQVVSPVTEAATKHTSQASETTRHVGSRLRACA